MKRRQALQRVALMMGTAVSAPTMLAIVQGCKNTSDSGNPNFAFNPTQQSLLDELTEIIIPKTNTVGAKDVGCGEFIQTMLRDCYSSEQQKSFVKGLEKVISLAMEKGIDMTGGINDEKIELMKTMQGLANEEKEKQEAKQIDVESGLEKEKAGKQPVVPFFNLLRELTVFGYFTSEQGAKQNLEYVPIPGKFEGCISISPDQKAYAL